MSEAIRKQSRLFGRPSSRGGLEGRTRVDPQTPCPICVASVVAEGCRNRTYRRPTGLPPVLKTGRGTSPHCPPLPHFSGVGRFS